MRCSLGRIPAWNECAIYAVPGASHSSGVSIYAGRMQCVRTNASDTSVPCGDPQQPGTNYYLTSRMLGKKQIPPAKRAGSSFTSQRPGLSSVMPRSDAASRAFASGLFTVHCLSTSALFALRSSPAFRLFLLPAVGVIVYIPPVAGKERGHVQG